MTMRTPSMVIEVSAIEVASPTLRRPTGAGALGAFERAVERHDIDRRIGDPLREQTLGAPDFRTTRQEREHRAAFRAQHGTGRVGNLALDRLARIASDVARLDRKGAPPPSQHPAPPPRRAAPPAAR